CFIEHSLNLRIFELLLNLRRDFLLTAGSGRSLVGIYVRSGAIGWIDWWRRAIGWIDWRRRAIGWIDWRRRAIGWIDRWRRAIGWIDWRRRAIMRIDNRRRSIVRTLAGGLNLIVAVRRIGSWFCRAIVQTELPIDIAIGIFVSNFIANLDLFESGRWLGGIDENRLLARNIVISRPVDYPVAVSV